LLEAERPRRSRTRFIGIALAITSHFHDPLGNDFAVEGVTKWIDRDDLNAAPISALQLRTAADRS